MSGIIARGQITIAAIDGVRSIYLRGTARDIASDITATLPRQTIVGGTAVAVPGGRGLVLVVIDRQTLEVRNGNGYWYDTYGDMAEGSSVAASSRGGCAQLVTDLAALDSSVFVALTSADAVGWTDGLIAKLKEFGFGMLPYTGTQRSPFAFLGYKGLSEGSGLIQQHAAGSYDHVAEVQAYVCDGLLSSFRNGRSYEGTTEKYLASASSSGVTTQTSGWGTLATAQGSWNADKRYLWNYEEVKYSNADGSTTIDPTTPHVVAIWTKDGKGIRDITNYYMASTRATGVTIGGPHPVDEAWSTEVQAISESKPYLWNYEKITYTEGDDTTTRPQVIGHWGIDGTSPIHADLDNEMDSVACNSEGNAVGNATLYTTFQMYQGSTPLTLADLYVNDSSDSDFPFSVVCDEASGIVEVSTITGDEVPDTFQMEIVGTALVDGVSVIRTKIFTVNGIRPGANGEPATIYQLVPSTRQVVRHKNGTYENGTVTCGYTQNVGGTYQQNPSGARIFVSLDGGDEVEYNTGGYDAGDNSEDSAVDFSQNIEFILKVGSKVVDRETVPVVADGSDGDDAVTYTLSADTDGIHVNSQGSVATGRILLTGWRKVGSSQRVTCSLSADRTTGNYYYCEYSINGGSTWSNCQQFVHTGNNFQRIIDGYGIPASVVQNATAGFTVRMRYGTQASSVASNTGDEVTRITLGVINDGANGNNAVTRWIQMTPSSVAVDSDNLLLNDMNAIQLSFWRREEGSTAHQLTKAEVEAERIVVVGMVGYDDTGSFYIDEGSVLTDYFVVESNGICKSIYDGNVAGCSVGELFEYFRVYWYAASDDSSALHATAEMGIERSGTNGINGKDAANVQPNLLRETNFKVHDLWVRQFGTKEISDGPDGQRSLKLTPNGSTAIWGNTYQDIVSVVSPATDYTASFWTKSNMPFVLYIDCYDASWGNSGVICFDTAKAATGTGFTPSTSANVVAMQIPESAVWVKHVVHFRTAASFASLSHVRFSFRTYKSGQWVGGKTLTADCTAYIAMPKLERGTEATVWMSADEDNDGYSVVLSPTAVIIEQDTEQDANNDYPLALPATSRLTVLKGGVPCGATVAVTSADGRCTPSKTDVSTGVWNINITAVAKDPSVEYAAADGAEVTSYYREGRVLVTVTPDGASQATQLYLDFHCNLVGVFTRSIKGDVETSIAQKITSSINDGNVTTLEEVGTYVRSASQNVSTLTQTVNGHTRRLSNVEQQVGRIRLEVYDSGTAMPEDSEEEEWYANGDVTTYNVWSDAATDGKGYIDLFWNVELDNVESEAADKTLRLSLLLYSQASQGNASPTSTVSIVTLSRDSFSNGSASGSITININAAYKKIAVRGISSFSGDALVLACGYYYAGTDAKLTRTGIDIKNRKITAQADNFEIWNNAKTKKTFSIDQDGNLMSAGDAHIGGTIRADNFFHKITQYTATNTSKPYTYFRCYVPQNYSIAWDNKTAEGAANAPCRGLEGQYVEAEINADCLVPCTHNADIVISTTYNTGYSSGQGYDIYIPKAGDFEGKVIEVYNLCTNTTCVMHIMEVPDFDASGNLVNSANFRTGWGNGDWNNYTQNNVPIKGRQKVVLYSDGSKWIRLGAFTILT